MHKVLPNNPIWMPINLINFVLLVKKKFLGQESADPIKKTLVSIPVSHKYQISTQSC